MTRLALAWLIFVPLASAQTAAPGADAFVSEAKIRAQASASVEELCKQFPPECEHARAVLEGYRSVLSEATDCEGGKGGSDRVSKVSRALWDLDEREALLPHSPGAKQRPLLRLSVLASSRLTAAAVRLGKPDAANAPKWNPEVEAPKVVETICLNEPNACSDFRGFLEENKNLAPLIAACTGRSCPFEEADALVIRADRQLSSYLQASAPLKSKNLPVFALVNGTRDSSISALTRALEKTLRDLNTRTDAFSARVDRADLPGLSSEGAALQDTYRQASIGADRVAHVLGYDKSSVQRAAVNTATGRIAGLRSRALALMALRGFKDTAAQSLGVSAAGTGAAPAKNAPALSPAKPPTLLDQRAVPIPADASQPAPPIVPGDPSWLTIVKNAYSADPRVRADALRRLGLTRTVGNPGLYAAQAYTQDSPTGCAVATQVSVLRAHRLLPPGDAVAQEKELIEEGRRRGLYDNGTSPEYSADLLVAHGMLVRRHLKASWDELTGALRQGHILQVGVDARYLWDIAGPNKLPHSILVTGAETSKRGGNLVGVYINDTGTHPPGSGRFIPAETFRKAWSGDFAEIQ